MTRENLRPRRSRIGRRTTLGKVARVLGSVVSAVWLVPLVGGLFSGNENLTSESADLEGAVLASLVIVAMVATGFAFAGFRWGAPVVLVVGSALCVFAVVTAGRNQWLAVSVAGLPWLVVGGLYLVDDLRGASGSAMPS